FAVNTYLNNSTLCIFWNEQFDFRPQYTEDYTTFVSVNIHLLKTNLKRDNAELGGKNRWLMQNNLTCDDLCLIITLAIEKTHCEAFIVFGNETIKFVNSFKKASVYSIWRSLHNKFIFVLDTNDFQEEWYKKPFFQDQPNILFITHPSNEVFEIRTNKYTGPKAQNPGTLYILDRFFPDLQRFQNGKSLFPNKLSNLEGREIIVAGFDYPPYTIIQHVSFFFYQNKFSNAHDIGVPTKSELHKVYIDGTETRVVMSFCEKFNCTVQINTSDADDWGTVYPNMSGSGSLGMVIKHKADICIGAMYSWYEDYTLLDLSMYLARSGITCLVPVPLRLASWYLPLEPFQGTLWAAVLVCLTIETFALVLAYKSEQKIYQTNSHCKSWWNCLKFGLSTTFKLFISQSGNSNAISFTVRVLLFACFLNDLIITSIYGGGLASILTIPSMDEAADTVQRLRTHELPWAANSEAWVSSIRGSNEVGKLCKKKNIYNSLSLKELVQDLLKNFHIYNDNQLLRFAQEKPVRIGFTVERLPFGHFAIGSYLVPKAIDQLVIMQDDLYYQYTVAFVPRLWPLLDAFNTHIYNWHSSGLDKYWEYRVVATNLNMQIQQKVESAMTRSLDDIGPVTLGMSNFAGIMLVWVLGSVMAAAVFAAEVF
ncbi:hypothetical protein KR074_003075, partial [Drosophila pseudoananassae]